MSKRHSGDPKLGEKPIYVMDLKEMGYSPEAGQLITLMGCRKRHHTEFFTLPDLIDKFDLEKLTPSPAASTTQNRPFNGLHSARLKTDDLLSRRSSRRPA
jgi:glutamyl/glutaminyl-tRNA synthetase